MNTILSIINKRSENTHFTTVFFTAVLLFMLFYCIIDVLSYGYIDICNKNFKVGEMNNYMGEYVDKKLKKAVFLYPFYEGMSGDLIFYSVVEFLFLSKVKMFSAETIAQILFITAIVDLLFELPSLLIIRRIGNSKATILGSFFPLVSIVMITFSSSIPMITVGNIFFISSLNFQHMSSISIRNNLAAIGKQEYFVQLSSKSNLVYSVLSMLATLVSVYLFTVSPYLPSLICIVICIATFILSFFESDYSHVKKDTNSPLFRRSGKIKVNSLIIILILSYCLFFCLISIFNSNSNLLLQDKLFDTFKKNTAIYIFGAIIWIAKIARICVNAILSRRKSLLPQRTLVIGGLAFMISMFAIGHAGIFIKNTIICSAVIGLSMLAVAIIRDPLRIYIRYISLNTGSPQTQQFLLTMLDFGQSVISVILNAMVLFVLKRTDISHLFIVIGFVSSIEFLSLILFYIKLKERSGRLKLKYKLNRQNITEIINHATIFCNSKHQNSKKIIAHTLMLEETLLNILDKNHGEMVAIIFEIKSETIFASVEINGEKIDPFIQNTTHDSYQQQLYENLISYK